MTGLNYKVIVAGHICLDIIPDLSGTQVKTAADFFQPGKMRLTGNPLLSTGGAVSNTGLSLLKLGIPAVLSGKIGKDPFGEIIQSILQKKWHLKEGLVPVEGETTSYTIVLCPEGYDRMFLHNPGANNTYSSEDIPYDLVQDARLFHFGYPTLMEKLYADEGKELVTLFRQVKAKGVITSLDTAYPDPDSPAGHIDWKPILAKVLPYVDMFFPSAEELFLMLEPERFRAIYNQSPQQNLLEILTDADIIQMGHQLVEMGVKVAGIKCGTRGLYMYTAPEKYWKSIIPLLPGSLPEWADKEIWEPIYKADSYLNANGAGDATIAGFLSGFMRGNSLADSLHYATAAGAFNVTALDTISGIPTWDQLVQKIRSGWEKVPLQIEVYGWSFNEAGQWVGPLNKNV